MTASAVHEPPRPNRDAEYRTLSSDTDWDELVDLRMACIDEGLDPTSYREFAVAKVATIRGLVEVVTARGSAPSRRGVCSPGWGSSGPARSLRASSPSRPAPTLEAGGSPGRWCTTRADEASPSWARKLVMVADPEYSAIRIYRSVGFVETETQLQAERQPRPGT